MKREKEVREQREGRRSPRGATVSSCAASVPILAAWAGVLAAYAIAVAGCASTGAPRSGSVRFDTATVWVTSGEDSTALRVEVARTEEEQSVGLSERERLPPNQGMLFVFEEPRADTAAFWMWRTWIPLDLALLDRNGVILALRAMDSCPPGDPDRCPVHEAGVEHWFALEVNRGWFARHGIEAGARVGVEELGR